jgi:regulator of replication initiation timing
MGRTRETYIRAINSVVNKEMTAEDVADILEEHIDGHRNENTLLVAENNELRNKLSFLLERMTEAKEEYDKNYKSV